MKYRLKFKILISLLSFIVVFGGILYKSGTSVSAEPLYRDSPKEIIIQMFNTGGIMSDIMEKTRVPDFTLYGDGRLIYTRLDEVQNVQLMETKVTPEYIRFLIGLFEKENFFQLNENYLNVTIPDLHTTHFVVNLNQRKKKVSVYGLTLAAQQGMIPRNITALHRRLSEFMPESEEKEYVPTKISLFVHEVSRESIGRDMKIEPWKVRGIDLRKYAPQEKSLVIQYKDTVLEGDDMKNVVNFLKGKTLYENRAGFLQTFFQNHRAFFKVAYRPHMPYEQ